VPGNGSPGLVVEKATLDACIWAPIANTGYLLLTPISEGHRPTVALERVRERFVPVMRTELATFLPYNLISFSMVPPLMRPFMTGFISMCFAVYISYITHLDHPAQPTTTEEHEHAGELTVAGAMHSQPTPS